MLTRRSYRAAQQIRFAKMPVRTRSGSSPIRGSSARDRPSLLITSPSRPPDSRLRRGSLGAVEAIKERARRDTATSSELSSENELDPSVFQRKQLNISNNVKTSRAFTKHTEHGGLAPTKESHDMEDEDSDDESVESNLSSEFAETADSTSLLDSVENPMTSSPLTHLPTSRPTNSSSPRKSKPAPPVLPTLPP